jgi:peptide/nickel transport system substrate-binding protein
MTPSRFTGNGITRRSVLLAMGAAGLATYHNVFGAAGQTPAALPADLVIDIANGPSSLDPALARSIFDWSIIHSIYDSILHLDNDGALSPLAAERLASLDPTTWEVVLRDALVFHDGSTVTAEAIDRSIRHVQASEGPAAGSFQVIDRVEIVDELTARIVTSVPAPWLPSQLAVWMVLFPESAPGQFETAPVGSGPFRFAAMESGNSITLERNASYFAGSPKGQALAERVTYRFVPESATRVADLSSGAANMIDDISQDQAAAVQDAGGEVVDAPVLGTSFLRLASDTPPFDDARVRQAINLAIDVESIAQALVSPAAHRIASIYPDERSIGFDPELAPFAFDPDRARTLLAEAGYGDGFDARFQFVTGGPEDVMQAIAANLADVGIDVTIEATELATFNGTWKDPESAPIRFVTWRPVYDPHTLLSLMFESSGFLSRHADDEADRLIRSAAEETDPDARIALYQDLGRRFQESPPAVFLWNLTKAYGTRDFGIGWRPRPDEYVIPTSSEAQS